MSEPVAYAQSWRRSRCEPGKPLTPDEARARHDAGETYTALLGDPEQPRAAVDVTGSAGVVTVLFLDERQRAFASSTFAQREGDRVFLEQVHAFELADDDDTGLAPAHEDHTYFTKDGSWHAERQDGGGPVETADGVEPDAAGLWEEFPSFGEYAGVSRYERGVATDVAGPSELSLERVQLDADVRLFPPSGPALTVRARQLDVDAAGVRLTVDVDAASFPVVVDLGLFNLQPEAVRGDLRRDLDVEAGAHLVLHLRPALAASLGARAVELAQGLVTQQPVSGVALSSTELWYAETVTQDVALPAGMEGSLRSGLATIWSPDTPS